MAELTITIEVETKTRNSTIVLEFTNDVDKAAVYEMLESFFDIELLTKKEYRGTEWTRIEIQSTIWRWFNS